MDEFELRRILYDYIREICHYSQMQVFATSSYQKKYFQIQIDDGISDMINFIISYHNEAIHNQSLTKAHDEQQELMEIQPTPPTSATPGENVNQTHAQPEQLREITLQELEENNGTGGKPAYVAVNGNVYDVTQVIRWAGGTHFGLFAGKDLTNDFTTCHVGMTEVLNTVPIVGILIN